MIENKKGIKEKDWVRVGLFRGVVNRIREFQGTVYIDVEIGGVVNPYPIDEVEPEESDEGNG